MIHEDYVYVTFKQAKSLKELGFPQNWEHGTRLYDSDENWCTYNIDIPERDKNSISCPTLFLVQKWLREEKNLSIEISMYTKYVSSYAILKLTDKGIDLENSIPRCNTDYNTYESALSAGIDKCIEVLKNN